VAGHWCTPVDGIGLTSEMDIVNRIKPFNARPQWDTNKKYQHWVFTIQGWDEHRMETLLVDPAFTYIIMGKEIGDIRQGEHLQGFCTFENQRKVGSVSKLLGGAWCEPAMSTDASIAYCKKDGTFVENGTPILTSARVEGLYNIIADFQCMLEKFGMYDGIKPDWFIAMNEFTQELLETADFIMIGIDEYHEFLGEPESDTDMEFEDGEIPILKRARHTE
jgi:hypothetical protein